MMTTMVKVAVPAPKERDSFVVGHTGEPAAQPRLISWGFTTLKKIWHHGLECNVDCEKRYWMIF